MKLTINFKGKKGTMDCPIVNKKDFDDLDKIMRGHNNFIKINNGWFNLNDITFIEIEKEDK